MLRAVRDDSLEALEQPTGSTSGAQAELEKSKRARAEKSAQTKKSKDRGQKWKADEIEPIANDADEGADPDVKKAQSFAEHLRGQFQYLLNLDIAGKQKATTHNFCHIALFALVNQSAPLCTNRKAKSITEWSKLRVAFKTGLQV
eukprot:8597617-Pyramimonas_sp.AAC.1